MLVVLSPAKALDFAPVTKTLPHTTPVLADQTAALSEITRTLSAADLKRLMGISDALAELNHARFQELGSPRLGETAKQAALAFNGDTYTGLDAANLTEGDLIYAQDHLRILSGLYGVLRPLDVIEPYRLEMGTKLANPRGKDLYAFWKGRISATLDQAVEGHPHPVIINCASTEYFKAAEQKTALKAHVITPVFHEERDGKARVIGLMAKRARGMMARFIITNRLQDPEQIKDFSTAGYAFCPERSDAANWVFSRPQP
jgi:cytoplasmic iron level regulating protein YaaA (DUF328/UPF0246 family)